MMVPCAHWGKQRTRRGGAEVILHECLLLKQVAGHALYVPEAVCAGCSGEDDGVSPVSRLVSSALRALLYRHWRKVPTREERIARSEQLKARAGLSAAVAVTEGAVRLGLPLAEAEAVCAAMGVNLDDA